MSLVKWSPFFFDSFEDMEKMFDGMQTGLTRPAGTSIVPPVDMYETKDAVVVETPLAGVDPKKIEISIDNGTLSIKGSIERKTEVEDKNYYRKEVRSGSLFRQVALPTRVDGTKAEASYENGILKIQLPKLGEEKTIKIDIKKA